MNVINPGKWLSPVRTEHEKEIIPFSQTNYCDITQLEYIYFTLYKVKIFYTRRCKLQQIFQFNISAASKVFEKLEHEVDKCG